MIAQIEQADQSADTRMSKYSIGLATSDRDAMERVYQYDAKKQQQEVAEYIYSDYDGIVDEVMVSKGSIIANGTPICSIRLTHFEGCAEKNCLAKGFRYNAEELAERRIPKRRRALQHNQGSHRSLIKFSSTTF